VSTTTHVTKTMKPTRPSCFQLSLRGLLPSLALFMCLSAHALVPFEVSFDFTRATGDRDWNFCEREPVGTYDSNLGTTNLIVVSGGYMSAGTKTNTWVVLNDPNPSATDSSLPSTYTNLIAGTNVIVRTRTENFSSGDSGQSAACGILFGLTGSGATQSGFLARVERGTNNSHAYLAIDKFVNGLRGPNLAVSPFFVNAASLSSWFLDLRVTSDGTTTNVLFNIFYDTQIPGTGSNLTRLVDAAFDTVSPSNTVSVALTDYTAGFLGLYFEDNSSTNAANATTGAIRYSNFYAKSGTLPPFLTLTASTPLAYENGASGAFTISRTNTGSALTVYYTMSGTATNGTDYQTLSGSTNFGASDTSVVIPVVPIDNSVAQAPRTVVLTLTASETYAVDGNSAATVTIVDDEPPVFTVTASDNNAYERTPLLAAAFTLGRPLGNPNTSVTVNFAFTGTAVLGTDYTSSATNSLVFAPGVTSQTVVITPIDNSILDGNRTVICTLQSGTGYVVDSLANTGTATIIDDEVSPETVLWSDNFDSGTSSANYAVTAAAREASVDDYALDFAYNYGTSASIPAPPGTATTVGFKLTANKNDALTRSAAVNVFPTNQVFSGNYALRFNVFLNYGSNNNSEEVLFGINQSGTATNWTSGSFSNTVSGDGIWVRLTSLNLPGATMLAATTNVAATSSANLVPIFNSPPFGVPGGIGNTNSSATKTWVDGELSQLDGVVTFKLDNNVLLQYTNISSYTSGYIMLGYADPFDSIGSTDGFAVFDNVRVVQLASTAVTTPHISGINVTGTTVQVDFTGGSSDGPANFKLQNRAQVNSGSFADDNTAVITTISAGVFRATTTTSGSAQFYRIKR
jgi:hypothetical protein